MEEASAGGAAIEQQVERAQPGLEDAAAVLAIDRVREALHLELNARFLIGDALTFVKGEPYDYVVASGIFGYNARDTRERVRPTLEHLFSLARIGMAVNFLSCRAPTRSPGRLYLQPSDVLQFALELTPAVKLDHTYLPNDFTVCLYRILPWDRG